MKWQIVFLHSVVYVNVILYRGAFSYRKLEEKRGKKHGCYILRQCQDDYNVFYLDVCTKNRWLFLLF